MLAASTVCVALALHQWFNGLCVPIFLFSQKLRDIERQYSTFGRELLALYRGVNHFMYFLEGQKFIILAGTSLTSPDFFT